MALTDKQIRFITEYMVDFNATKAAKKAGYSEKTAYSIGQENLTKPEIKTEIDRRMNQLGLSAEQTTKLIVDIAKASLNDYFKVTKKEVIPQIRVGLQVIIDQLQEEIVFEEEFANIAGYNEEERENHQKEQDRRKRQLLRLQLTLKRNPHATDLINGEPEIVEYADLDIPKLVQDKEAGKIKSYKITDNGIQVEMYPADAALTNLARIHGLFEKDNKQVSNALNVIVSKDEAKEIIAAINDKI
jgi:phage terminase small subunit